MPLRFAGYRTRMTNMERDQLAPELVKESETQRAQPDVEGDLPEEESIDEADFEERLDEEPDDAVNRRDVPPTPENTVEARTEDD